MLLFVLEVELSEEAAKGAFVADTLRDIGIREVRLVQATRGVVSMLNKSRSYQSSGGTGVG